MNSILLLVGIVSGLSHSLYSAISKTLLKNQIKLPFLLFLYISLFQAMLTPVVWIFVEPTPPPLAGWKPILIAGITGVIAFLFLYSALSSGDVSSVMPILGSKVIFAGFMAVPLLGEKHGTTIYFAAVLVAISIAVLSYSPTATRRNQFPLKPILLMILCSIFFAVTDIYIKRSLAFLDSYNFMVYYNLIVGTGSLSIIPYIYSRKVSLVLKGQELFLSFGAAIFNLAATLLFATAINIAQGVLIPNILQSTRGVFIVIISAFLAHRGSTILEIQNKKVYLLRFFASALIILSIWITLSG